MPEAKIIQSEHGLKPEGEGWYVLNARDAEWKESVHFGSFLNFQGDVRFDQMGVNINVLQPGKPACMYHSEDLQEAFLVLSGECLLVVEEQERSLRAWDFVHCPPGVHHVFVGAGDGPCVILMMGSRVGEPGLHYPVSAVAGRHGASAKVDTPDPAIAYKGLTDMQTCTSPLARALDSGVTQG